MCAEAGAPLSWVLGAEPSRRGGGGAGGGDLRKPRRHLGSQVRAGAVPASPIPAAEWALSPVQAATPAPLARRQKPSAQAQVTVATCVRAPGAGAGCACPVAAECVYIWGHVEEVEPRAPGGRRDQRYLLPLPHSQDLELNRIPSPSVLLLPPLFTREQV